MTIFPPLIVKASAGSGKTHELSSRYLGLLSYGEKPSSILGTTFTRKAAAEIQERIFLRLARAVLSPKECSELNAALGSPAKVRSATEVAALLEGLVSQQHTLAISTLDGFFQVVARLFPLELGLVPEWRVMDDHEERGLIDTALHRLLASRGVQGLADLVRLFSNRESSRQVHDRLAGTIGKHLKESNLIPKEAWGWLAPREFPAGAEITRWLDTLAKLTSPLTAQGEPNKVWAAAVATLQDLLQRKEWDKVREAGLVKAVLAGKEQFGRKPIASVDRASLREIGVRCGDALVEMLRRKTLAVAELTGELSKLVEEEKRAAGVVSFSDVKQVLAEHRDDLSLAELFYRLDGKVHHILFDEFQDTSPLEWRALTPLVEEILSQARDDRSFLCVGDMKQALYGWRGGAAELFDVVRRRFPHVEEVTRNESRRCAQPVLDFVNLVFARFDERASLSEYPAAAMAWSKRFTPHYATNASTPGFVSVEELPAPTEQADSPTGIERALEVVRELHAKNPSLTIGVLFRKNDDLREFASAATSGPAPLAVSEEGGTRLWRSPAVRMIAALLTLLDHPADREAYFLLAASPLGRALQLGAFNTQGDIERLLPPLRKKLIEEGLGSLVASVGSLVRPYCEPSEWRRVQQLITFAFRARPGTVRTDTFVETLREHKVDDPTESAVRALTIHGAKGLEFDAVVLPELAEPLVKSSVDYLATFRSSAELPPERVCAGLTKSVRDAAPELAEMITQIEANQLTESLSVLYVALTRAKHALYLILPPWSESESKRKYSDFIRESLGGAEPLRAPWESGDSSWWKKVKGGARRPAARSEIPSQIHFPAIDPGKRRGLPRRTPSSAEGTPAERRARVVAPIAPMAAQRGSVLHALLAECEWVRDGESAAPLSESSIHRLGLTTDQSKRYSDRVKALFAHKAVREVFRKDSFVQGPDEEVELWREKPFLVRDEDALLTGTFDRVVVVRRKGVPVRAQLFDFKTDSLGDVSTEERVARVRFYEPQLGLYREALAKLLQLPPTAIAATLVFTDLGEVHHV